MIAFGLALELGFLIFFLLTGAYRSSSFLVGAFWLPFAIYLAAVFWVFLKPNTTSRNDRRDLRLILGFTLLFQLTFFVSSQPLSDDIYRYAWDGKMLLSGINPYRFPPQDEILTSMRDAGWLNIQNKSIHTMYPPLAQLFFALTQTILPGIASLKFLAILAHLGSTLICFLWLKANCTSGTKQNDPQVEIPIKKTLRTWRTLREIKKESGYDPRKVILFAWSPLCILEFSNSGHIDALAIFFMLCAFYLSHKAISRRQTGQRLHMGAKPNPTKQGFLNYEVASAVCLSAAVLVKVFPIFCLPFFLPVWKKQGLIAFLAPLAIASLPFFGAGEKLLSGTAYFTFFSTFNASAFSVLWLGLQQFLSKAEALYLSRLLVYTIFLLFWAREFFNKPNLKAEYLQTSLSRLIWIYGLIFILSPTLHPWYLTWILPFLCFTPRASWLFLTGLVFLSRSVYTNMGSHPVWQDVGAVRLLEYIPFYVLLLIERLPIKPRLSFPFRLSSMKSGAR